MGNVWHHHWDFFVAPSDLVGPVATEGQQEVGHSTDFRVEMDLTLAAKKCRSVKRRQFGKLVREEMWKVLVVTGMFLLVLTIMDYNS